jgi:hypothetical protein
MNKRIFSIIPLAFLISSQVYSNPTFNVIIGSDDVEYKVSKWYEVEPEYTEWVYGEEYNCSDWSPLLTDYNYGIDFEQSKSCSIDKTRTVQEREKNTITGEFRNVGEAYEEKVTKTNNYDQDATGTFKGTKCLDILNKGEHNGSGNYTLSDNSIVFCEMEVAGGGYQLKTNKEYIPDGNLTDGTGVDFEDGSNPAFEVIYMTNPVSNYVIKQTRLTTRSEYEVHPNTCDIKDGEYFALTLWQDKPYNEFWPYHNRYWDNAGGYYSDRGSAALIDQTVVGGKTWYKYRYISPAIGDSRNIQPITDLDGQTCHSWYIGYGSYEDVSGVDPVHFTGMSFQVYTK